MGLMTRFTMTLGRFLPFLKVAQPAVDRQAVMHLRPAKNTNLTWAKSESGEVILTIPQNEKANALTRWFAKWLEVPKERRVELDEVGSYVWEACDGKNTVETIVRLTGQQFKMNRREAEVSVTMFLQMLHERKFIGFYKKSNKKQTEQTAKNKD